MATLTGTFTITCDSSEEYTQTMTELPLQPKCQSVTGNPDTLTIQVSITDPPPAT